MSTLNVKYATLCFKQSFSKSLDIIETPLCMEKLKLQFNLHSVCRVQFFQGMLVSILSNHIANWRVLIHITESNIYIILI